MASMRCRTAAASRKASDGERADRDEEDVDGAGEVLAAAAVGAVGEMLIVIRAHCRGEARDVVAPAGEDVADERIGALRCGHAARSCRTCERN